MKHLILVILLALAPLSWAEEVWACAEERSIRLVYEDGQLGQYDYPVVKSFGVRLDRELDRLTIQYDDIDPLVGEVSFVGIKVFTDDNILIQASVYPYQFSLNDDKFYMSTAGYLGVAMSAGTCTKF